MAGSVTRVRGGGYHTPANAKHGMQALTLGCMKWQPLPRPIQPESNTGSQSRLAAKAAGVHHTAPLRDPLPKGGTKSSTTSTDEARDMARTMIVWAHQGSTGQ